MPGRSANFRWITLLGSTLVALAIAVAVIKLAGHRSGFDNETLTIFILGGSTAEGAPYYGEVDFGRIAALCLGSEPGVRVENLARSSMAARFVLEQARRIARNVENPDQAVVFVYSGNNEFLPFDPSGDPGRADRLLFDRAIVPPRARADVMAAYRDTVAEVITVLRRAKIPLVVSTIAVNEMDWEPNRSVLTQPAHQAQVEPLWWEADKAFRAGQWDVARRPLEEILRIEPAFAHASFRMGRVCLEQGEIDEAKKRFREAIDNDGNPTRVLGAQNEALAALCREQDVPLIDAAALLENASEHGLVGYNLMWDNCHPTLEGYALIGSALAREIGRLTGIPLTRTQISGAEVGRRLLADPTETLALAERAQYCYVNALITWDRGPRLERAAYYLQRAIEQRPGEADFHCSLGVLRLLEGAMDDSVSSWRHAYRLDPVRARTRLDSPQVRQLFQARGVTDPLAMITGP